MVQVRKTNPIFSICKGALAIIAISIIAASLAYNGATAETLTPFIVLIASIGGYQAFVDITNHKTKELITSR